LRLRSRERLRSRRLAGLIGMRFVPGLVMIFRFRHEVRNVESVQPAQFDGYVFIDGAGVRFLFRDTQFREPVKDFMGFDFQFPSQLVDPNLLHR